jgi:EmrB/QacA subfamily drug resistance transporter
MTPSPTQPRTHPSRWLLPLLLAAPFMAQLDATIANVAIPAIHTDLHASGSMLQLVIGGYLIAFAMLLITGARLGHSWGYRNLYIGGMALFSIASLACGLAPSAAVLVITRVCQGTGAAMMLPQSLSGIQINFTGQARMRAIGLYAAALSGGAITGQILGGVLVSANIDGTLWRPIFLLNVPVGLVILAGAFRNLPKDHRDTRIPIDVAGIVTLSTALLLIVLPLILGQTTGWPIWTWLMLAASIPTFAAFLAVERRATERGTAPLINLRVLSDPPVLWSLMAIMLSTIGYYAILFCLAQYMQEGLGHSALISGLTLVPWVIAFGLAGRLHGSIPDALRPTVPFAGAALLVVAYASISVTLFSGDHSELPLLFSLAVGGFGLGVLFSALMTHITDLVPADYAADISGVSTTVAETGGVLGVAAFGTLYLAQNHVTVVHASHAFAVVALGLAGLSVILAAATVPAVRSARRALAPQPA